MFTSQLKSVEDGRRSCLLNDCIRLRITRSSEAAFFLPSNETENQIQRPIRKKFYRFSIVCLSSSVQSFLEQDLNHVLTLEFDLSIELDLIDDVAFHQKI